MNCRNDCEIFVVPADSGLLANDGEQEFRNVTGGFTLRTGTGVCRTTKWHGDTREHQAVGGIGEGTVSVVHENATLVVIGDQQYIQVPVLVEIGEIGRKTVVLVIGPVRKWGSVVEKRCDPGGCADIGEGVVAVVAPKVLAGVVPVGQRVRSERRHRVSEEGIQIAVAIVITEGAAKVVRGLHDVIIDKGRVENVREGAIAIVKEHSRYRAHQAADEQIEVAIPVDVREHRPGLSFTADVHTRGRGHVGEGAVTVIAKQPGRSRVAPHREDIGQPVVIVVADRDTPGHPPAVDFALGAHARYFIDEVGVQADKIRLVEDGLVGAVIEGHPGRRGDVGELVGLLSGHTGRHGQQREHHGRLHELRHAHIMTPLTARKKCLRVI